MLRARLYGLAKAQSGYDGYDKIKKSTASSMRARRFI